MPAHFDNDHGPSLEDLLYALRRRGWSVACHNDYRQSGQRYTFWLFTHENGQWVKGEGRTDHEVVTSVTEQVDAIRSL